MRRHVNSFRSLSNSQKGRKIRTIIFLLSTSFLLTNCNNSKEQSPDTEVYSPLQKSKGVLKSDVFIFLHHKYDTDSLKIIEFLDFDSIPYIEFEQKKIFQGDIILSGSYNEMTDSIKTMIEQIKSFNELTTFTDIPDEEREQYRKKIYAVGEKAYNKLWSRNNYIIPYLITSSVDEKNVRAAIKLWQDKLAGLIRFEEIKGRKPPNYVVFTYGSGYSSEIGMKGGPQNITIAADNKIGNIAHEIGHLLGLWHEHSHPERDEFIIIKEDNIAREYLPQFILKSKNEVQMNEYDFNSIMHYGRSAFSKNNNPNLITIQVKDKYKPEAENMGQRDAPSQRDILMIKELYKN